MYNPKKSKRRPKILQLDYDDESSRSTPSPNTVQRNGRHRSPSPPPAKPAEPPTVMDDEFANFMAEIDAMDDEKTPERVEREETPEPPPVDQIPPPPPPPDEDEDETFDMAEPLCDWQQCLDENTQCYYYWHMHTNDVSWDIPPEFTQHLFRYKEYEEARDAYNARKAVRESQKSLTQPPPPPADDKSDEEDENSNQGEDDGEEMIPQTEQGRNFLWFMRDHEREEKAKQEEKKKAYSQKFVKGKTLDEEKKEVPKDINSSKSKESDSLENRFKNLSGHSVAMLKGKGRSKFLERIGAQEPESDSRSQSPSLRREEEETKEEEEEDEDEDEMALLLELQQKQEELMALEKAVCQSPVSETPSLPPPEEVPLPPPPPEDPPLPPEPEGEPPSKRPKLQADKGKDTDKGKEENEDKEFVPKEGSCALTKDQSEIEELSSTLVRKLECLQITRDTMSKMQILLVEIQTRLVDWVSGALSTGHLLGKLRDAAKHISDYETIAAPPGWTCHYDREMKQYYYMNAETGASQWEYPITKADMPLEFGNKAAKTEDIPPPPRTPSPPPPPAMQPPPPPPPGILSTRPPDLPPPPPPPGLEPASPEHDDMEIDEDSEVTVPELLPPPIPAALRPKNQPPQQQQQQQQYYPMGHYYPRPRPFPPTMGHYYPPQPPPPMQNYYSAPAPAPPPAAPEPPAPPARPVHVNKAPVLFKAKEEARETNTPTPPPPPEPPKSSSVVAAAPPKPAVQAPPLSAPPEPPSGNAPSLPEEEPTPPPPAPAPHEGSAKKKKKKDKLKVTDTLSLKRKNVSGMVMKWQQAQQQVNQEVDRSRRIPDDT